MPSVTLPCTLLRWEASRLPSAAWRVSCQTCWGCRRRATDIPRCWAAERDCWPPHAVGWAEGDRCPECEWTRMAPQPSSMSSSPSTSTYYEWVPWIWGGICLSVGRQCLSEELSLATFWASRGGGGILALHAMITSSSSDRSSVAVRRAWGCTTSNLATMPFVSSETRTSLWNVYWAPLIWEKSSCGTAS